MSGPASLSPEAGRLLTDGPVDTTIAFDWALVRLLDRDTIVTVEWDRRGWLCHNSQSGSCRTSRCFHVEAAAFAVRQESGPVTP